MPRPLPLAALLTLVGAASACSDPPGTTPEDQRVAPIPAGWGALFWRGEVAYATGGGAVAVGPKGLGPVQRGAAGPCGLRVEGAPKAAVLAPPDGVNIEPPPDPPAVANTVVEAAVARAGALLPPADLYTPAGPNPDPTQEQGVQVGSVVKARRVGAPPILVVSAYRGCTGLLALLDASAAQVIDSALIPGVCLTPRALAPADLDGDGHRETALFNAERVVLFRLDEAGPQPRLQPLGDWSCPNTPSP